MRRDLGWLRARAVGGLAPAPDVGTALARLGFVQADPLRKPATAQDLILRHRTHGYRAGDLDQWYPSAPVEEGVLYAHGFLPRATWGLLRPPPRPLDPFDAAVLAAVRERGDVLPKDLDADFGRASQTNAWGSRSRATALALERLHAAGRLRVAGRVGLQRRYAVAGDDGPDLGADERLRRLVGIVVRVLSPAREATVRAIAARLARRVGARHLPAIEAAVRSGDVERVVVDGIPWLVVDDATGESDGVRLLAPFDPVVWDRQRFALLWGWEYRFEAYTPASKRQRGHYALPLLVGDRVIGWANVGRKGGITLDVGFAGRAPRGAAFRTGLEDERARLEAFLTPR